MSCFVHSFTLVTLRLCMYIASLDKQPSFIGPKKDRCCLYSKETLILKKTYCISTTLLQAQMHTASHFSDGFQSRCFDFTYSMRLPSHQAQ